MPGRPAAAGAGTLPDALPTTSIAATRSNDPLMIGSGNPLPPLILQFGCLFTIH